MKKAIAVSVLILTAGVNFSRAGELEALKASLSDVSAIEVSDLQKINVPVPGLPQNNIGHNTPHPNYGQMQTFRFASGEFTFRNDAERSMMNAIAILQRGGYPILERNLGRNAYTLAFMAPGYGRIERYKSGEFTFSSDAQRAADECAAALGLRGIIVLEKNVSRKSFTISYLFDSRTGQLFRFESGVFASRINGEMSLNNAIMLLRRGGYPILETNLGRNTYTLAFMAPSHARIEQYKSAEYPFAGAAQRAADECAAAFVLRGMVILEKNVSRTSFTIRYLNPAWHR